MRRQQAAASCVESQHLILRIALGDLSTLSQHYVRAVKLSVSIEIDSEGYTDTALKPGEIIQ